MRTTIAAVAVIVLGASRALADSAPAKDDPVFRRLTHRAIALTPDGGSMFYVPAPTQELGMSKTLARALIVWAGNRLPFVIYSTDPHLAARVTRSAFRAIPRGHLLGVRVICLVGRRYDSYLRPAATAAGARLHVEDVGNERPNQAMQRTAGRSAF